jgi:hypothetical protein
VVFADSLSRWVEAVPAYTKTRPPPRSWTYSTSTSYRYGVPRAIVSDRGSNLVGKLKGMYECRQ